MKLPFPALTRKCPSEREQPANDRPPEEEVDHGNGCGVRMGASQGDPKGRQIGEKSERNIVDGGASKKACGDPVFEVAYSGFERNDCDQEQDEADGRDNSQFYLLGSPRAPDLW